MSPTPRHRPSALVKIASLYMRYYRDDYVLTHILQDPRAEEVGLDDVVPLWAWGDINAAEAWKAKGLGVFPLVSIHFWNEAIDFDYIDVGANYGLTTIDQGVFHKRCGHDNRVYALEPGDVFSLLEEFVKLNRIQDIATCLRAAASDEPGDVVFHLAPAQSAAASLLSAAVNRQGVTELHAITVNAIRLDDLIRTTRRTEGLLIKIDAEGADFKVLRGMTEIIATRHAVIQIEFTPSLVETYTDPIRELAALSQRHDLIDVGSSTGSLIDTQSVPAFVDRVMAQYSTDILLIPHHLPGKQTLVGRLLE